MVSALLALAGLAAGPAASTVPQSRYVAHVEISVTDRTGAPLPSAHITVRGLSDREGTTNPAGQVVLTDLPAGIYALRALAITTEKRSPLYPQLPTVAEAGVPGYQSDAWYGVLAPAKTPDEIIARLNREIITILRSSETRDKLASQGAEVSGSTSAELARLMQTDIAKWAQVTARLKIQPQ